VLAKLANLFTSPVEEQTDMMRLSDAPFNTPLTIQAIHTEKATLTLLRFGLSVGDSITLLSKVSKTGPLILEANNIEFALGNDFGLAIEVTSA
jgi:Fe2+ transport system protein FeoA